MLPAPKQNTSQLQTQQNAAEDAAAPLQTATGRRTAPPNSHKPQKNTSTPT